MPPGQSAHAPLSTYRPGAHVTVIGEQLVDPGSDVVPAAHGAQLELPESAAKVPAMHCVHEVAPTCDE